jgi:hypothetical protein
LIAFGYCQLVCRHPESVAHKRGVFVKETTMNEQQCTELLYILTKEHLPDGSISEEAIKKWSLFKRNKQRDCWIRIINEVVVISFRAVFQKEVYLAYANL